MSKVRIQYEVLRNVTSPSDEKLGRIRRCGAAPANVFFPVPDDQNVREYLQTEIDGKPIKKATDGSVNKAIWETLENRRQDFTLLNAGLTIIHGEAHVNDKDRYIDLTDASIINGSQTRGVLADFFDTGESDDKDYPSINFELIYAPELAAEISIARNFQNAVQPVSTYGKRGLFDDLEQAMQKHDAQIKLRKSETDVGDEFVDTQKVIQVTTVVVPSEVKMPRDEKGKREVRAYAFSQKAVCLKDFAEIFEKDRETGQFKNPEFADARRFFLDVAFDAWTTYRELCTHQGFSVFRQKRKDHLKKRSPVQKDRSGQVIDVAQGVVFPVLSALGKFIHKNRQGHWDFKIPDDFELADLIEQAEITFSDGPGFGDPAKMGKDPSCYLALYPVVTAYLKYRAKA
jgi:hypothetical protein